MPETPFSNAVTKCGFVYLNDRIEIGQLRVWNVPEGRLFVMTDIVVQNRAPGDQPVASSQFTRFNITSPAGTSAFFDVIGNHTLSEHFVTGLPVSGPFQFSNAANSTAPFVECNITGILREL